MSKIIVWPTMDNEQGTKAPVTYQGGTNYQVDHDGDLSIKAPNRSVVWARGHFQRVELIEDEAPK